MPKPKQELVGEGTVSVSAPTPLLDIQSLSQESWVGEKTCLMTSTRTSLTIARLDTAMGLYKRSLVNVTFCSHCWRRPTDSTTLEEALSSKAGGSGQEAQGHTTTWGYWRVKQILVISCRSCLEENRGHLFLWKLQEAERLFPTTRNKLTAAKWFSTLDLKSTYWQVVLHPDDNEKMAYLLGQGLWKFMFMPFGLCSASVMFE